MSERKIIGIGMIGLPIIGLIIGCCITRGVMETLKFVAVVCGAFVVSVSFAAGLIMLVNDD